MNPDCMYLGGRFKGHFKNNVEWFKFYVDNKKEIHVEAPVPYGKDV